MGSNNHRLHEAERDIAAIKERLDATVKQVDFLGETLRDLLMALADQEEQREVSREHV